MHFFDKIGNSMTVKASKHQMKPESVQHTSIYKSFL